jgi:hypothetical protein
MVYVAVVVVGDATDEGAGYCGLFLQQHALILATEVFMTVALLLFSLLVICCDYDPDVTPAMRRCAYLACAACFVLDLTCSFLWSLRHQGRIVSFGPFTFVLANQVTSCIASQVVIMLHLLYVSCRSRRGQSWAYPSLRFELAKQHNIQELSNPPTCPPTALQLSGSNGEGLQAQDPVRSNAFLWLWHRLLSKLHSWRHCLQSAHDATQVFSIPCLASGSDLTARLSASSPELARPLFHIRFPSIVLRFAELHGNLYICAVCVVAITSLVCYQVEHTFTATMVLNIVVLLGLLGFFSCKRYNVDSVAAKHVATSFRFVVLCMLVFVVFAMEVRLAYLGKRTPQNVIGSVLMLFGFILTLFVDCSPHLPQIVQTTIPVSASIIPICNNLSDDN